MVARAVGVTGAKGFGGVQTKRKTAVQVVDHHLFTAKKYISTSTHTQAQTFEWQKQLSDYATRERKEMAKKEKEMMNQINSEAGKEKGGVGNNHP